MVFSIVIQPLFNVSITSKLGVLHVYTCIQIITALDRIMFYCIVFHCILLYGIIVYLLCYCNYYKVVNKYFVKFPN